MLGEDAGYLLVTLVPDEVGDVLLEVAAERDVEHLRAAADGEHGQVALEGRGEERDLGAVALRADVVRLRVRLGVVQRRVEVRAAREDEPVEHVERLVDRVLQRRHEQRPAAGRLDLRHVRRAGRAPPARSRHPMSHPLRTL